MRLSRKIFHVFTTIFHLSFGAQFALPGEDDLMLGRSKRDIGEGVEEAKALLTGFLRLSADIPLTPKRRSNFGPRHANYKIVDHTEYAVNQRILDEVFETDLVLSVPQLKTLINDYQNRKGSKTRRRSKRKAIVGRSFRWPNQTIPFVLAESDGEWRQNVLKGMKKWARETCIHFQERTNEKDYVHVFRGAGCYSSVGRIGGRQYASIGYGCESEGIVAHELGHAIGFWHEQSRPDRDVYININENNIIDGTKGNFEKRDDIVDLGTTYDFGSVMHYGPQAFTNNYDFVTIETKDHRFQHTIGQRKDLSFIDIKEANALYCKDRCKRKLQCLYGGYENPRNCHICKCPPGLSGIRCQSIPNSTSRKCGGELLATASWKTLHNKEIGSCYWRISTQTGKIRLEVLDTYYLCDASCPDNYLEIKHTNNLEQTGFRQCCNGVPGIIISETNQVYIISSATRSPSNFTIRYIIDSSTVPKPPPGRWNGGGITSLIGAENGIDNTWEKFVLNKLPEVLRSLSSSSSNPWAAIGNVVKSILTNRR